MLAIAMISPTNAATSAMPLAKAAHISQRVLVSMAATTACRLGQFGRITYATEPSRMMDNATSCATTAARNADGIGTYLPVNR